MASLGGNILSPDIDSKIVFAGIAGVFCFAIGISRVLATTTPEIAEDDAPGLVRALLLFAYGCFLKPHRGDGKGTQQDALESFYKAQAGIYDSTRRTLLKGREEMLALVAAQLEVKSKQIDKKASVSPRRIWVDVSCREENDDFQLANNVQVGGGTGWNIEAMAHVVNVPEFFSAVYLVDFSPSLCEVARKRFARLGWNNVKVICEDARKFKLEDYEDVLPDTRNSTRSRVSPKHSGADLITMSYSLSMIVRKVSLF